MIITWHGFSCFRIQESRHGGEVSLVTDPFEPESGKKLPRNFSADVITISHDDARHNASALVAPAGEGAAFVITGPGEYEVKDMFVTGISIYHEAVEGKEKGLNTIYRFNAGGLHMVHLGDLKHPMDEKYLEEIHDVDVLFVPIGGALTAKQAVALVSQIEPRIIIPMYYKSGDIGTDLEGPEAFIKAMGLGKPEIMSKFKITAKELPQGEMKLVILEPQ